jgi:4-hydroxy-2-oxoheptanedioate aldolase
MKENHVKKKLKNGDVSIGTWLNIPSSFSAERCARIGFDWLIIDMEHNPINIETAANMIMAINQTNTAPLVRIPWNHPEHVKRVLDAGAWGVLVPMVCTKEEAEQAVMAAKYPPQGIRSNGGGRYGMSFDTDRNTYTSRANTEIIVAIQIEHIDAVNRAEEILSVEGIDACLIGPNDLMTSMGMIGKMDIEAPEVKEALEHVVKTANKYGVTPGIHTGSAEVAIRRIDEGFRFVAVSTELNLMISALEKEKSLFSTIK